MTEPSPKATPEVSSEPTPEVTSEPATASPPESTSLPDATALVATFMNLLAAKAWETMGLVPNPATKQVERKLDEAQLAIDAAAALAEVLRPRVGDADRRDIETLVTNLRLNFVEQKNKTT